jgi:hypothetical protein
VRGWGSPNADDWRKSLALCGCLLSALCGNKYSYIYNSDEWRKSTLVIVYSVLLLLQVSEVLPDQMRNEVVNTLLFNQAHLYEAEQPGT